MFERHTNELPTFVETNKPLVAVGAGKVLYAPLVGTVDEAAERVRTERLRRGWSAAVAARQIVAMAASLGQPIELSQQAVSHFENGKGKSVPNWVATFDLACEFCDLEPEERQRFLNLRRGFSFRSLPLEDRMQLVGLFVAFPDEDLLTDMFETMLLSMPTVERAELPRELAKLLPSGLEGLRYSIPQLRLRQGQPQSPPADPATVVRGSGRASRT